MIRTLVEHRIAAFEAAHDTDLADARALLDVGMGPFLRFQLAAALGADRRGVPLAAWHAARLVTLQREDCGPCLDLAVSLARADGVSAPILRAILHRDAEALPDDVALALRFTLAVQVRDDDALEPLREAVVAHWGPDGLVALAFAALAVRLYPDLKVALGYGRTCRPVIVDDEVLWTPGEAA